jgi:hypothetical protein
MKNNTATAYDYQAQKWIHGAAAIREQHRQMRDTLELLKSPAGDAYCAMIACPNRAEFIAELEAELAQMTDPGPLGQLTLATDLDCVESPAR